MKTLFVGIAMFVCVGTAQANVLNDVVNGTGAVVKTAVTVTHSVVHGVQAVAGGVMGILHVALDLLNVPFEDR